VLASAIGLESRTSVGWRALTACALGAALVFVGAISWFELASVDLGYHLGYGRQFLEKGAIVVRDPFIYAATDYHFINANWGFQVVMAWLDRVGGVAALQGLRVGLLAIIFAGALLSARGAGLRWGGAAPLLVLVALGAYERFDLRPELASYAAMVLQIGLLVWRPRKVWLACVAAFAIQLVWVNAHSYFLTGPMLYFVWLVGDWVKSRIWRAGDDARGRRVVLAMLAAQIVASFCNPWGARGAWFPIQTLLFLREQNVTEGYLEAMGGGPWAAIGEFRSPLSYVGGPVSFRTIQVYLVLLGVVGAAVLAALRTRRWGDAAAMALLTAMSLSMRRNVAPFAIGAVPLALAALDAWAKTRPRIRGLAAAISAAVVIGVAAFCVPQIWTGRYYAEEARQRRVFGAGLNPGTFPIAACEWIRSQRGIRPRVFVDFFTSSNTLPWLPAGWQVFVDTNTFAYPPAALRTVQDVTLVRQPPGAFFDAEAVNVVLLHPTNQTQRLIMKLAEDPGWALVWVDPGFLIFIRRIPEHAAIIAENHPTAEGLDVAAWERAASRPHQWAGFELGMMAWGPLALGWDATCVELLKRAVELMPSSPMNWMNLGTSYGQLAIRAGQDGRYAEQLPLLLEARRCFERALRLEPDSPIARRNLQMVMQALGNGS